MPDDPLQTQEFVGLLTNHQEVIRAYIISQLPGCSEIHDILQDVNFLLWEKRLRFKAGTNFGAWACTVAYYKVLEYRKKLKKDGILVFDHELATILSSESENKIPEALAAKRDALHHCLKKLSDKDRALLGARYGSASNDLELISHKTGRTRASLRVSLSRLRAGLKDCINQRLGLEGGLV